MVLIVLQYLLYGLISEVRLRQMENDASYRLHVVSKVPRVELTCLTTAVSVFTKSCYQISTPQPNFSRRFVSAHEAFVRFVPGKNS